MHEPLAVVHEVRDALALAALERIPPYLKQQRSALLDWFSQPQGPLSDPLIEFDPPFEDSELSWEEVVQEGLIRPETLALLRRGGTIKSVKPYRHQLEAIRSARQGKSIVVSAGTGSGKTECFLIPILDDLIRESLDTRQSLRGLRSLLIYPLNALVFDQMGRWRAVLGHQKEILGSVPIRLSMYNAFLRRGVEVGADLLPTFQALGIDENDADLRPYLPLEEGEVTRREGFLSGGEKGANLVITNYVMLELALLRHVDQRWLNEASGWKHLVLDEAHSYTGGLAVDIALLLRRIRDRIGPMSTPQGFATSATFGGSDAKRELSDFSSVLFGQKVSNIEVIQGHRVGIAPDPKAPKDIQKDYSTLIGFLKSKQDPEKLRPLIFSSSELKEIFPSTGEDPSVRLGRLLGRCSEARSSNGQRALLPHRLHAVLRRPIPWASQCINPSCPGQTEIKGFRRWPMLGWIGQDPSDDKCPKCHGPMLLPVTCGYEGCAQEGLLGKAIYTGFPPRLSELVHPLGPSASGVEGSVLLVLKDEWPEDRPSLPVILKAGAVCEVSESDAPWRIVTIGSDEEGKQTCPRCDQPETLENTWSNKFHAGAMDLIALDRLLSLQLPDSRALDEPGKGRRVLTFADSRQGAARLAPRLAFTHRVLLVRRWIIDTLGSLPDSIPQYEKFQSQLEGLRRVNEGGLMDDIIRQKEAELATLQSGETILGLVQEMAKDQARLTSWAKSLEGTRFQQRFNGIALLSGAKYGKEPDLETLWYGLIRNEVGKGALNSLSIGKSGKDPLTQSLMDFMAQELLLSVLRELCRPAGRTPTATKLGLVQIQWPSLVGTLESLTAQGIPEPLHQEVFERACNLMLEQRCVMLPRPFTGQEEDWGQAFMNRRAVLQESSNPGVFSFASDRIGMRKFTAFLDLLCQHCKGRTDETWNKRVYVALWEGLRQVAQGMPILNFTSVDGVDSLRLNAEMIQIRSGKGAFLCERCGSTSPWGLLKACSEPRYRDARGKERSEPCAGMLLPIDPSLDQGADSDAYPHAHNVLLRREPPEGLTAFEHTAQRSGDQVRRDELLFRQAKMNVLCSSTTLEMGIDLPDLDSVVLMGVPPAASNHTQRVGRAGRSRARSCLALTFAGEDSFDRWAHRDLKAFLKRPGITPRVDLEREEKLRQHFFAWRLGLLVRGGDLVKVGSGSEVLNKISVFAGIDPEIRRKSIDDWNSRYPETPWTLDVSAPGWGDEAVKRWETLTVEQWTRGQALFGKGQKILAGWLKEGRKDLEEQLHRIRKQVLRVEESISNGPEQQTKFMRLLVHSLRQYDALQWLAENHLLPRFGFPISSVSLRPPKAIEVAGAIERDRRQAVMEWTPGATVVVANRSWTVKGLTSDVRRGQSDTHHRLFTLLRCRSCGHQHVAQSADLGSCPVCSSSDHDLRSIVIPFAFASEDGFKLAGTNAELPPGRSSRILTLDDRQWPEGMITFRPSVHVAFLNLGHEENGFWLCSGCGRMRRVVPGSRAWTPCCVKDTTKEPDAVVLGEVVRMDVLRIRNLTSVGYEGMRAASHALRLAAAFLLELDPRTLALSDITEDAPDTLYLVDLTSGGSGLLARLQEKDRLSEWLSLARSILSHEHRPSDACANACPECLLTHDNRAEHRIKPLRRLAGVVAMDLLMQNLDEASSGRTFDKPATRGSGILHDSKSSDDWSWDDVLEYSTVGHPILNELKHKGAPIPEVGLDLVLGQETVGTAEWCWPEHKVAVILGNDPVADLPGWTMIPFSDSIDASAILRALNIS
jgi:DEAD/DEAH box helicase/Helicase conserved C-terminal domain/Domain of unknown function (DUF1998)